MLLPATIDTPERDTILRKLDGGLSERRSSFAWEDDGVFADALASELPVDPVGLLMLEEQPVDGEERASYWIACPNFYSITRYNRSRLYAAAVFNLAQAIVQRPQADGAGDHLVLLVDDVDDFLSLVGVDGTLGD